MYMCYIGSVLCHKPNKILKNGFLSRSQNKVFPIKNLAFKFFIFSISQICNFCQIFKKTCFIIFIDVWPLPYQCYSDLFIFDNVIRITLKVSSIRILLSIGS